MPGLIIKSKIREIVKKLDSEGLITSVAEEVEEAMDKKAEEMLIAAIQRAKANQRKTLLARDL
jgi:histone H3/H4